MRSPLYLSMMCMLGLMLAGCIQFEPAKPSVGIVDSARVFRDSEAGKAGVKFLESMHEKMQAELNTIQEALQKNPDDAAMQQRLQGTYMDFQQRMGAEQQNVITLLNDATQRVVDGYLAQKKFDVILSAEAALAYNKAVDCTADIIAELNKQKVDYKPIQPEAAAVEPTDAPKAEDKAETKK